MGDNTRFSNWRQSFPAKPKVSIAPDGNGKSLPTDAEQDMRPNFNFAVFHRGERVLADSDFR